jgi:hypothetical protein
MFSLQKLYTFVYRGCPSPESETILVEAFPHHYAFNFSCTFAVVEKKTIFSNFCPALKAPEV